MTTNIIKHYFKVFLATFGFIVLGIALCFSFIATVNAFSNSEHLFGGLMLLILAILLSMFITGVIFLTDPDHDLLTRGKKITK